MQDNHWSTLDFDKIRKEFFSHHLRYTCFLYQCENKTERANVKSSAVNIRSTLYPKLKINLESSGTNRPFVITPKNATMILAGQLCGKIQSFAPDFRLRQFYFDIRESHCI